MRVCARRALDRARLALSDVSGWGCIPKVHERSPCCHLLRVGCDEVGVRAQRKLVHAAAPRAARKVVEAHERDDEHRKKYEEETRKVSRYRHGGVVYG